MDIAARAQRQRILDAIVASCAANTFQGTTISDIVARASISRTTFYKHFVDKRACFDAAVDTGIEEVRMVACEARLPNGPPAATVPRAGAAILRLMAEKPQLAQLLAGEAPTVEPSVVGRYRRLLIPAVANLWEGAEEQPPRLDPKLAFGRLQLLVYSRVSAGEQSTLPELLPELVYLAVAPFAGHGEALRLARQAEGAR
jgi:AcrR family transcriptional regulator